MGNTLERRNQLVGAKTGYTDFIKNNGDIPGETMYSLSENLSLRMKEVIMSTMTQIHNWKDAIRVFRAHLNNILKNPHIPVEIHQR